MTVALAMLLMAPEFNSPLNPLSNIMIVAMLPGYLIAWDFYIRLKYNTD